MVLALHMVKADKILLSIILARTNKFNSDLSFLKVIRRNSKKLFRTVRVNKFKIHLNPNSQEQIYFEFLL